MPGVQLPLPLLLLLLLGAARVHACTNVLVTPGASEDGSARIAYNADDTSLYGVLYHYPSVNTTLHKNESISIHDWDSGKYLGEITQTTKLEQTHNVVGNANEHGLVIAETTFGGVSVLAHQSGAILDYGSLIYITLQRAKTAREAIETMDSLLNTYGYASQGESFSIADQKEVWMMEVIGRGDTYGKLGAVWVAYKIPNGYVAAHANQARIRTFPRDKPDHCLYAPDVVDVAIHYGLYPADAATADFSFSDVYDPVQFSSARFCEARVWSIFSALSKDDTFAMDYLEYAAGRDLSHRMPLFIQPKEKLTLQDVMHVMNSHYEGTELDASLDVGSGLYASPHRPRPLTWEHQGKSYFNERFVATYRTGWNFVAEIRPAMPAPLATLLWFAVDDSSTTPRFPIYASSTAIPPPYAGMGTQDGVPGPMLQFDINKAFWVQNMVSNLCYTRWSDCYPYLRNKIDSIHHNFQEQVMAMDAHAVDLYKTESPQAAIAFVTEFSVTAGSRMHQQWWEFYGELFARLRDFSVIVPDEKDARCQCKVQTPGLSEASKKRIALETGTHYVVPPTPSRLGRSLDQSKVDDDSGLSKSIF